MKKRLSFGILIFLSLFIFSCSNDENTNSSGLTESPEAIIQFDNSNFGIYKGVFIGSSGIVVINVNNEGKVSATMIIDGTTYIFTTSEVTQENQQTVINFTSGNDSFTFSVSSNGTNPEISNLTIAGHPNANIILVKETSVILTELFEGSYAGIGNSTDAGTFNAIVAGNKMAVLAYSNTNNAYFTIDGTINNNSISGVTSTGTNVNGTLNGNNMIGTWNDSQSNENGNWSGKRTY
ncbi:hypothetical protein BST83_06005 [Polaribacter filamentus]|jgi:hypothetical protein|uniref:Uncharacterized protein n=1 Tax=Polaribacter filamentus TaxID=53483 RepID=A0A2S7KVU7_9FLAO|nr:hypothetical protein [Polaribacter filamentus]PQB06757.1 hypothetical protein BST83_06005 [Polaribacter filamentus]